MNKSNLITLAALLVIVVAFPIYAAAEPQRMAAAHLALRQELIDGAAPAYLDNCASCHGAAGEGLAAVPPLNLLTRSDASATYLYEAIAHAAHGSAMAAWHSDEGGVLSAFKIRELVALIQYGDWDDVQALSATRGQALAPMPELPADDSYLLNVAASDPHRCVACHEEPPVHVGQFGLECSRCHATSAWQPALLTRHIFDLNHGETGLLACQTCHTVAYTAHVCTECHDHEPAEMEAVHLAEGLTEIADCARCHPTGAPGEADQLRREGTIRAGVAVPLPVGVADALLRDAVTPLPGVERPAGWTP